MPKNSAEKPSLKQALLAMRGIWATIVFSQIVFFAILVLFVMPGQRVIHPQLNLAWLDLVMLLTVVPMTFSIRNLFFRRTQVDGRVPIGVYQRGNLIFWAACEGVSFFGLVVAMVNGSLSPTIWVVLFALGLQAMTFPLAGRVSPS